MLYCITDNIFLYDVTNEEGALRLLSQYPHPEQVREIRDQWIENTSDDRGSSLLHYACRNGWYDVSRQLVEKYHCDAHLENWRSHTPLHYACQENGNIDIVRFLVVDQHCDPACHGRLGRTPLSYACQSGKLDIVRFLVEECHCDPFRSNAYTYSYRRTPGLPWLIFRSNLEADTYGRTPLHWATWFRNTDVVTYLLSRIPPLHLVNSVMKWIYCLQHFHLYILQIFMRCRKEYPLEGAFKILVLGNHAAGKSTLVKVIENEITSLFGSFFGQRRNISKDDVEPLTAGIVPVSVESRRLGHIVIYDMAGQYQYYSSHAALLRNLVSSSASMFLVVVSLNQSKEGIVRQLQYWRSFIANCCTSAGKPLAVAVFSHADEVTEEKPEGKSSQFHLVLVKLLPLIVANLHQVASQGLAR